MVQELKKYFNYVTNQAFHKKKLNFLILYVTSSCNFRCRTCFFHRGLNKSDDLSFEEFDKISKNLGTFSILLIGGGEPFSRPDLELICSIFIKRNKIDTLYIPTNGFLTDKILLTTEFLLKKFPGITLSVNPSLDGTKEYHEKIKNVPGSFEQAIKTIEGLSLLKKNYQNLQIIVNSVINQENIDDLKELAVYLRKFDIDYHAFEILRGDKRDKSLSVVGLEEIKKIHNFILENRRWYLEHRFGQNRFFGLINKIVVLGQLGYAQYLKEQFLSGGKWPFRCAAGVNIAVVYPNGEVGLCELMEPVDNLRHYGYNLKNLLSNQLAKKQIDFIKKNNCSCTHICFINSSIARDWKTALKLPYFYLKNR